MTREITHEAKGPVRLDEEDLEEEGGTVWLCRCGLSDDQPFCDNSHKATADEEEGAVYKYEDDDDEQPRHEIDEIVYVDD